MERRTFLAAIGTAGTIGLAGCTAQSDQSTTQTPTNSSTPTNTDVPGTVQRRLELVEQDTIPDRYNLTVEVELRQSVITDEVPGRLQITVTNTGDKRALSVHGDQCDLFNRQRGASTPRGLWLHQPGDHLDDERKPGKWTLNRSSDDRRGWAAYACATQPYASSESNTTEYEVWDDYTVEGYFEPGTYRWEEDIGISDTADGDLDPDTTVTWGFAVKVIDPNT